MIFDFGSSIRKLGVKIFFNIDKAKIKRDRNLFKKLKGEIWEFRTLFNKTYYQIFAFWDKENKKKTLVLAAHAIIKKMNLLVKSEQKSVRNTNKNYNLEFWGL